MESSALNFQSTLQSLTFKTFYHNRTQQFGYDDLFANQRVIIFSVPTLLYYGSPQQIKSFHDNYADFKELGIDDIYCVNSMDLLIGPYIDRHSGILKGLADLTSTFVSSVANYYNINKPLSVLTSTWQFILVIDNGKPEMFWHNPVKEIMPLSLIKNKQYVYHGLTVEKVKKYLVDNKSNI